MNLPLHDMSTPAQPPTDDLLELLQYAAVTGGAVAVGIFFLVLAAGAPLVGF